MGVNVGPLFVPLIPPTVVVAVQEEREAPLPEGTVNEIEAELELETEADAPVGVEGIFHVVPAAAVDAAEVPTELVQVTVKE
jgi:hypothetical protein